MLYSKCFIYNLVLYSAGESVGFLSTAFVPASARQDGIIFILVLVQWPRQREISCSDYLTHLVLLDSQLQHSRLLRPLFYRLIEGVQNVATAAISTCISVRHPYGTSVAVCRWKVTVLKSGSSLFPSMYMRRSPSRLKLMFLYKVLICTFFCA